MSGKKGVVQVGPGEDRGTWGNPRGRISRGEHGTPSLCREDGGQDERAERVSATDQATRQGRGHRSEATKRITGGAASGGRAEKLPEHCPGSD